MENQDKSLDVLGIKPFADAVNTSVTRTFDGVGAVLSRICLPAAEEFGLLLKDKVHAFRTKNTTEIIKKFEEIVPAEKQAYLEASPRIVHRILEDGSWIDVKELQNMWGGLLASSCTFDGKDDSNLIFINLLSQITVVQVRVINYACVNSKKVSLSGLISAEEYKVDLGTLEQITEITDLNRLDRELDHLRSLELITIGFEFREEAKFAEITPTPLALNLYIRCQGFTGSPIEFFELGTS